jgi:hypothetical protein
MGWGKKRGLVTVTMYFGLWASIIPTILFLVINGFKSYKKSPPKNKF